MNQLLQHFGFSRHPFARATPKEALFRHRGFEEAGGRLRCSAELDSIALLVAESGCGKSLLLGDLNDQLRTLGWVVLYCAHATTGPFGLINVLARKVGLAPRRSRAETAQALSEALISSERKYLLILDEAHVMPDGTLQDLRLLTIADFDRKSPFLLLLCGQPPLEERLAEAPHRALDQRISTVARLAPLSLEETQQYIAVRLAAAGVKKSPLFEDGALEAIFDDSAGVPRRINNCATAALIGAATRGRRMVGAEDCHDARVDRGRS
jgi:type II secretory pathway predicted ATPase ExeA